jgi:hypothetical protein
MRKALVAAVGLAILASLANAAEIRIFLSTGNALNASSVGGLTPSNPAINPGAPTTVYLWAQRVTASSWTGLGINVVPTAGVTVTGKQLYNPNMGEVTPDGELWTDWEKYRWQNGAATSPPPGNPPVTTILPDADGQLVAVAASGTWLLNLGATINATGDKLGFNGTAATTGNTNRFYLIGEMQVQGPAGGSLKLAVGPAWITSSGGLPATDLVDFGFGDPAIRSQGIIDNVSATGGVSALADLTITPEPASLILLALAGLALRRR